MANHQSDVFIRGAVSQQIHSSFHPALAGESCLGPARWTSEDLKKGGHHELLSHFKAANTTEKGTLKTMFYFHQGRHFKIKWFYQNPCFKYIVSVFRLQTRRASLVYGNLQLNLTDKVFSRPKKVVKLVLFSFEKEWPHFFKNICFPLTVTQS